MTTTPLPPLPEPEGQCFVDLTPAVYAMWERQMRAYAAQARADLEAEVARLRAALEFIEKMSIEFNTDYVPRSMGDVARAALESKP